MDEIRKVVFEGFPEKIRPSTASLCCWFPICSQQRNQILVQTANTNWLEFMPALLVLSQEENIQKCLPYRNRPKGNGDHKGWRPLEDPLIDGRKDGHCASLQGLKILDCSTFLGQFLTRPAGRTAGQATTSPRFTRIVFDLKICATALKLQIIVISICRLCSIL